MVETNNLIANLRLLKKRLQVVSTIRDQIAIEDEICYLRSLDDSLVEYIPLTSTCFKYS